MQQTNHQDQSMKIPLWKIWIFVFLVGCTANKPTAELIYKNIYFAGESIAINFYSNIEFDKIYADNRLQNVVRTYLLCALDNDENFDVKHRLRYTFEGNLALRQPPNARESRYSYRALGSFYANSADGSEFGLIRDKELVKILGQNKYVPCKVIMTVYFSSSYYSNTMLIPVSDIKRIFGQ